MAIVERDGVKLAYATAGAGEPGLIFVHGWSCNRSYFQPQFDFFSRTRAVAALDLRGHGESDQPESDYAMEALGADVSAVATAAGLELPIVVGHSMGGYIAVAMAAAGTVRGAVLVDSSPLVMNDGFRAFFANAATTFAADTDGSARKAFVEGMFLPTDAARRAEIIAGMPTTPPRIASACIEAMVEFDGAVALAQCQVPVLSIGASSPANTPGQLSPHCPSVTFGQTVGAGHFNQLEVPDQVNGMIAKFLEINGL